MKLILTDQAKKQYKKLAGPEKKKVKKKLLLLTDNPLIGPKLTGEYTGTRKLKAWPYRIIYLIKEQKKEIWVIAILHRQGAYK